jgi:hypothetical protein
MRFAMIASMTPTRRTLMQQTKYFLIAILALGLGACAHKEKGHHGHHDCAMNCDLKERARGEAGAHSESNIKTATEGAEIRKQIGEAKTDLFKAASSKAFASKEVTEIKDKITKLDQKRLVVMYQALADVQNIVGFGPDKEELYRRLREYDSPREGRVSRSEMNQ